MNDADIEHYFFVIIGLRGQNYANYPILRQEIEKNSKQVGKIVKYDDVSLEIVLLKQKFMKRIMGIYLFSF